MPHLIRMIGASDGFDIPKLSNRLKVDHDYLVERACEASKQWTNLLQSNWGTQAKRIIVNTASGRPRDSLIEKDSEKLGELVNQVATIERLIDVLNMAPKFSIGTQIFRCHPCTSSRKSDKVSGDNDLILCNGNSSITDRFEISDIATEERDGNGKEYKDLKSLGFGWAWNEQGQSWDYEPPRYDCNCYLVISSEFLRYLESGLYDGGKARNHWRSGLPPYIKYKHLNPGPGETAVLLIETIKKQPGN